MKIIDLKTFIVGNPPDERSVHRGRLSWIFLKLMTDKGIHGWGEGSAYPVFREYTLVQLLKEMGDHFVIIKQCKIVQTHYRAWRVVGV